MCSKPFSGEECEDKTIHMDLKPQNVLLGADFFPKISDFGMSRRVLRGQQSAVVTMMRGTPVSNTSA